MDLVNKLVVFTRDIFRLSFSVNVKKSPSFQNVDIFPELDRCTPCVFIGTVARFSRNKSLLISFGAPVVPQVALRPDSSKKLMHVFFICLPL